MTLPKSMRAMVLGAQRQPLELREVPVPRAGDEQVLLRVVACGVCRTDLHILDGDLSEPKLPLILGHEIVGEVVQVGNRVQGLRIGDRVGVPWLGSTCGCCKFCRWGQENLCDEPAFTGYTLDGGYAEFAAADARYCFSIPTGYTAPAAAPLLCAGLIGYRTYRMTGDHVERLGIYGFGAAGHLVAQIAVFNGQEVYAFTRPGDTETQAFARRLGAVWAGDSNQPPPETLDAAMILAPVGALMVEALQRVRKGGVVVSGGIHMSEIPSFSYDLLWGERRLLSVANLTRADGEELMRIAPRVPVKTSFRTFALERANEALDALRAGQLEGAGVLVVGAE
jgi:propanol-preferring alcohol dehydrogenase